ncbi:MAG: AsmA-like C-terminal region-containing protein, partial [Cyclobacteriaceae bacterium]
MNIIVDENGNANYDIALTDEEESAASESDGSFNVGIDHWQIRNGTISYADASLPLEAIFRNVNHSGSGDFTQDQFDLNTQTSADSVMITHDGVTYISNKSILADAVLNISDNFSTFTFRENSIAVNEFTVGIDGIFKMLEESYQMDLTVKALDNSFKSLLSLTPGIYKDGFESIRANGTLDFEANIKGTYTEDQIPAFNLKLATNNSMFQYPDLPTPVSQIDLDLRIQNSDGIIENTSVEMPVFHAELGSNPIDATLFLENLRDYAMRGSLSASLNFADITAIFPVEGMEIRGNGKADISFEGKYDSINHTMPEVSGNISISNGYVRSAELPYALEKVSLVSTIENPTGQMKDFRMTIKPFDLQLDGAPFMANGEISNLDNYTWDLNAQGSVDLKKLVSLLKLKDMQLEGQLMADIQTRGNMAALEAERYGDLPTSGDVTLRNFAYDSPEMPEAFNISEASVTFDPSRMSLVRFESTFGSSDFSIKGSLSNYIGYILDESAVLRGNLDITSKRINLNELMTTDDSTDAQDTTLSVIPVPDHVEFVVNAKADNVDVTNMNMENAAGRLKISDETVYLEDFTFNMLGGKFESVGNYSTKNKQEPSFEFGLDVDEVMLAEAFKTFELVQKFAPVAGHMKGKVSTEISLSGLLEEDMSPELGSINADGLLEIINASLTDSRILQGISSVSSLDTGDDMSFENLLMNITIRDGRLQVDPFTVNLKGYETEIMGTTSLDGSIAYQLTMQVPGGSVGTKLNEFL